MDCRGKTFKKNLPNLPEVLLVMADNSVYEVPGKIETASGLVDQQTGAVNVQGYLSQSQRTFFAAVEAGWSVFRRTIDSVIIIPQKTSYELQGKHFVYLVGPDNKVHNTEIEVY